MLTRGVGRLREALGRTEEDVHGWWNIPDPRRWATGRDERRELRIGRPPARVARPASEPAGRGSDKQLAASTMAARLQREGSAFRRGWRIAVVGGSPVSRPRRDPNHSGGQAQ